MINYYSKLRHPCICQFLGIAVKEQGYCIVSELMYCSLYSFVREEMKLLSSLPRLRWNIASNIAQGTNTVMDITDPFRNGIHAHEKPSNSSPRSLQQECVTASYLIFCQGC